MNYITSLEIVTNPSAIHPGQAISCEYTATPNTFGTFANLGNATKEVIQDYTSPNGKFYFICVGYTPQGYPKLIADRNIQTGISYDTISNLGTSFGKEINIGDNKFRLRLLKSAFQNDGTYLGEYDQCILNYDLSGLISKSDAIWNTTISSWTSTTPTVADSAGTAAAITQMIARGGSTPEYITNVVSSTVSTTVGFRPILVVLPVKYSRGKIGCSLPISTNIETILPGQAISCEYVATAVGAVGTFSNFGKATKDPISDLSSATPDGSFYFICVGYNTQGYPKLVADRNIQNNISWEALQGSGFCTTCGIESTLDGEKIRMRILNTISQRHASLSNYGEWDAIISLYNSNGISASDNNVWNCKETLSWTLGNLETVDDIGALASSTLKIARGMQDTGHVIESQCKFDTTQALDYVGFRPVLVYTAIPSNSRGRVSTPLVIHNKLSTIIPGQAISCEYTAKSGVFGIFNNLGTSSKSNILDIGETTPDGTFYFICVGYTPQGYVKLVADRNIQTNITWDELNAAGMCLTTGTQTKIGNRNGIFMRLIGTLADRTLSSANYGEWDAIISYFTKDGITASDNNIWNCKNNASWTNANISTIDDAGTVADHTYKIGRGNQDIGFTPDKQAKYLSTYSSDSIGFRPVIYYNPALASNLVIPKLVSPTHLYNIPTSILTEIILDSNATSGYFKLNINGVDRSAYGELQELNGLHVDILQYNDLNDGDNIVKVFFKDTEGLEDKSDPITIKKEIPYRRTVNRTFLAIDEGYIKNNITFDGQAKVSSIYTGSINVLDTNKFSINLDKYVNKIGVI